MKIEKGTTVGISVTKEWRQGADRFVRQHGHFDPNSTCYLLFAQMIDDDDPKGLWVKYQEHDETPTFSMLIPWNHVLTVVEAKEFSAELRCERKYGYDAP
jgi:hypothetical protein